jgi:hypothetical protein
MTLSPKFNPRLHRVFRIVKLGFVKGGGDNLLFWIKSHLLPFLIISGENRYEASTRFFVHEGDLAYAAASPTTRRSSWQVFDAREFKSRRGIVANYS